MWIDLSWIYWSILIWLVYIELYLALCCMLGWPCLRPPWLKTISPPLSGQREKGVAVPEIASPTPGSRLSVLGHLRPFTCLLVLHSPLYQVWATWGEIRWRESWETHLPSGTQVVRVSHCVCLFLPESSLIWFDTAVKSPATPEPQKCILKSKKCHFGPPGKMAPKVSQKSIFGEFKCPKAGFLDILINFGAIFPGGKNGILRTLNSTFGVSGFRGSVAGRGICNLNPCL